MSTLETERVPVVAWTQAENVAYIASVLAKYSMIGRENVVLPQEPTEPADPAVESHQPLVIWSSKAHAGNLASYLSDVTCFAAAYVPRSPGLTPSELIGTEHLYEPELVDWITDSRHKKSLPVVSVQHFQEFAVARDGRLGLGTRMGAFVRAHSMRQKYERSRKRQFAVSDISRYLCIDAEGSATGLIAYMIPSLVRGLTSNKPEHKISVPNVGTESLRLLKDYEAMLHPLLEVQAQGEFDNRGGYL